MAFKDGAGSQTLSGFVFSAYSAVAAITVNNVSPANLGSVGSTATTALLQFAIDNTGGVNSDVQVQVSTSSAFSSTVFTTTLTNVANGTYSVTATGLTLGTKYYWRVRAANTGTTVWGPWSGTPKSATYRANVLGLGPWAFWEMAETTGTILADSSGNGKTLTISGSAHTLNQSGPNASTKSIAWANAAGRAETALQTPSSAYTVETWVNYATAPAAMTGLLCFADSFGGGTADKDLSLDTAGKVEWAVYNGSGQTIVAPSALGTSAWHHVVASVGAAGTKIRIDKTTVVSNAGVTSSYVGSAMKAILRGGAVSQPGNGPMNIGPTAVYYRQLADAESDANYDAMAGTLVATPDPWSFTLVTGAQQAGEYLYENVGISTALVSTTGEYVVENVGIAFVLVRDAGEYFYENVGYERLIQSIAGEYIYEGDVSTNTPTPHVWWLVPDRAHPSDGVEIYGFGFGDLQVTYNGKVILLVSAQVFDNNFDGGAEGWAGQTVPAVRANDLGDYYLVVNPMLTNNSFYRTISGFQVGVKYKIDADVWPIGAAAAAIKVDGIGQGAWGTAGRGTVTYEFVATAGTHTIRVLGQIDGELRMYRVQGATAAGGGVLLGVTSWQTFPPTANAYTVDRLLDQDTNYIDMQHQVIGVTIPNDALPPGYPIRVETDGP